MIFPRRKARQLALQILYEIDTSNHDVEQVIRQHQEEREIPEAILSFAIELVRGVIRNKPEMANMIAKHAPSYPVHQLATIDRNILELAIQEILFDNKVPKKAAINEAVELAKKFGAEGAPRFVNGVLGSIMRTEMQGKQVVPS